MIKNNVHDHWRIQLFDDGSTRKLASYDFVVGRVMLPHMGMIFRHPATTSLQFRAPNIEHPIQSAALAD
jgi:hypothetical protein